MARYRRDLFRLLEAALVGLSFVQATRFLFGTLYAHLSSASLVRLTIDPAALANQPGVIDPADVEIELLMVGIALFVPMLSILFGRLSFGPALAAIVTAAGRVFMTANGGTLFGVAGAVVTAGAAALYFTLIAVRRPGIFPAGLVAAFALDQLIRIFGSTVDPTWSAEFLQGQTVLSLAVFVIAILTLLFEYLARNEDERPMPGEISGWGAFALGGLLYMEFAVLGLPHLVAHRAGLDFLAVAPWLVVATLLPLVGELRALARGFLAMFDGWYRGWVWFLLLALLVVVGFRFDGPFAAGLLIGAQFMVCLSFWWVVQPAGNHRNFTGIGMIFSLIFFLLLVGGDFFTYEYAFVRGVAEPLGTFLRAFRGLGLAVALLAVLLACLPAILARKRLPWRGGRAIESLAAVALVVLCGVLAGSLVQPVVMATPANPDSLRVATLNLHGGFSPYFGYDLPALANEIERSGVDVLLLQQVEAGRLISFSDDHAAWLARRLRMTVQYFPTNEPLQGLAVLARLPIQEASGALLTSQSRQTGVQFVRLNAQDDRPLDVYNAELTLPFRGGPLSVQQQEQDQTRQLLEIMDYMGQNESSANRLVLAGTFNQQPGGDIYTYLQQQGFADPFGDYPQERAATLRLINEPAARVDYVWLQHIVPLEVGITPIAQSSHNMPIAKVAVGPAVP
jgi:endonuclease/exonuclease/phosphatase family metal-dependent hydrolase